METNSVEKSYNPKSDEEMYKFSSKTKASSGTLRGVGWWVFADVTGQHIGPLASWVMHSKKNDGDMLMSY